MERQVVRSRALFWAASASAAVYWLLFSWRIEQALWDLVARLALVSESIASLVPAIDTALVFGFVATAYAVPPLLFAACVRLARIRADGRTWAIPSTGFLVMFVFLGSESLLVGGGPLDLLRISTFADASWSAFASALCGLGVGSAGAWLLLAKPDRVERRECGKGIERTASALD